MSITQIQDQKGYLGPEPTKDTYDVMVINNYAHRIHTTLVHIFKVGDVEDPELYAAQPIWEWQQTEMGKWVMEKAIEPPVWQRHHDLLSWGYQYAIIAKLKEKDYTFWALKWSTLVNK